ncbi:MAG TPA: CPBP family intramembrane glutamic endopeptidase [Thermoanaerobaculia bacterium]|nr:CPBP family intramembrane glutamic endopeptidase [Thermoanaerobaculia bacterium]
MLSTGASIAYLVLVCGVLPLLAWMSKRVIDRGAAVAKLPLYLEALALQLLLLAISYGVATIARIGLFRGTVVRVSDVLLGGSILGLALLAMAVGWRFAGAEARNRVAILVPTNQTEKTLWVGVSFVAGVSEEIAFRGVLPAVLYRMTGSFWAAIVVSTIAFALAHLVQGWTSALLVGLFGLLFHALVWATGGLWVAIAVHVLYDVIAGLTIGRLLSIHAETADAGV